MLQKLVILSTSLSLLPLLLTLPLFFNCCCQINCWRCLLHLLALHLSSVCLSNRGSGLAKRVVARLISKASCEFVRRASEKEKQRVGFYLTNITNGIQKQVSGSCSHWLVDEQTLFNLNSLEPKQLKSFQRGRKRKAEAVAEAEVRAKASGRRATNLKSAL